MKSIMTKKILLMLAGVLFLSCQKDKNNVLIFDEVEYYHSSFYKLAGPPDNTDRFDIYYSDFVQEKNKFNYTKLAQYGFLKREISNDFEANIKYFLTDKNPGKYFPDYRCLNCYQDILIFYNKKELIGVAKFDFLCNKYCFTSFLSDKNIYLKKDCLRYKHFFKE